MENINPDAEIEEFWFNLKQSMSNFYNLYINSRPIHKWSNNLNDLQSKKKYEIIEKHIRNYISLYGMDVIRQHNHYHISILNTNIKRWNKLSNKYTFTNKEKTYYNIIFVLLDIYKTLIKNKVNKGELMAQVELFSEFELFILYNDYGPLIKYAIKYNKTNIIDKLIEFDKESVINTLVENDYDLSNININTISSKKLIEHIKNQ